jgi:hypothetical protein
LVAVISLVAMVKARQSFQNKYDPAAADGLQRGRYLLEAIGWAFLVFLILTPGFGLQYLSWLVGPGLFLGVVGFGLYTVAASVFLFRVYTYWSGGFPWYFANSQVRGQWWGVDQTLDMALWWLLVGWAAFLILRGLLACRKRPGKSF